MYIYTRLYSVTGTCVPHVPHVQRLPVYQDHAPTILLTCMHTRARDHQFAIGGSEAVGLGVVRFLCKEAHKYT